MVEKSCFYTAEDVAGILGVSKSKAYSIIQNLNKDLKAQGFVVISGKVSTKYFESRLYIS